MAKDAHPPTKEAEAQAESSTQSQSQDQETPPPPSYTPDTSSPPNYESLRTAIESLSAGDPDETILVPMISRRENLSIHNYNPFSRKSGGVTQSVTVRKMKREMYLKHYAKDAEGKFIGTSSPAPDAGLVFVPGKSTPEDLLRQVQEVAFARQEVRGRGIGKFGEPYPDAGMQSL